MFTNTCHERHLILTGNGLARKYAYLKRARWKSNTTLNPSTDDVNLPSYTLESIQGSQIQLSRIGVHVSMCYQIVEKFAACQCIYHVHSIDPCQNHGRKGHSATVKTILVGLACPKHGKQAAGTYSDERSHGSGQSYDLGYASATRRR